MGQPGWSNSLGASASAAPKLLVDSEVDPGPKGVPGPRRRPTVRSHLLILGDTGFGCPYCPTFGLPPAHLAAAVRDPED